MTRVHSEKKSCERVIREGQAQHTIISIKKGCLQIANSLF